MSESTNVDVGPVPDVGSEHGPPVLNPMLGHSLTWETVMGGTESTFDQDATESTVHSLGPAPRPTVRPRPR